MSYQDNRDHEEEAAVKAAAWLENVTEGMALDAELTQTFDGGITVGIAKVGGGTQGRKYDGYWEYWFITPQGAHHGTDLYTGTPKSHDEALWMMFDFAAHYGWIEEGTLP